MNSKYKYVGLSMSLGLCFGVALGTVLHNVGVGIGLGVSLGLVFGAALGIAPTRHRPTRRRHYTSPCPIRWVCSSGKLTFLRR